MLYKNSKGMRDCICVSSAQFIPASAPAAAIALPLNVYDYVHVSALEELNRAFAHVLGIGGVRGDDVDDAQDSLLAGTMAMIMVVVVMVLWMRVAFWVCVRVIMVMVVAGVLVLVPICVAMIVGVDVVMAAITATVLVILCMCFCMCCALILHPEFGNCVANDTA